jgi:hypothetical protein
MTVLPRARSAIIPIEKFTEYALDPIRSRGKWIAFLEALGYHLDNAELLVENIRQNIHDFPAEPKGDKGFGMTYAVLMELVGENGRTANVLTAWLDDNETGLIRLTSAYVKKRKGGNDD